MLARSNGSIISAFETGQTPPLLLSKSGISINEFQKKKKEKKKKSTANAVNLTVAFQLLGREEEVPR